MGLSCGNHMSGHLGNPICDSLYGTYVELSCTPFMVPYGTNIRMFDGNPDNNIYGTHMGSATGFHMGPIWAGPRK